MTVFDPPRFELRVDPLQMREEGCQQLINVCPIERAVFGQLV